MTSASLYVIQETNAMQKKIVVLLLASLLVMPLPSLASEAQERIKTTIDSFITVLKDPAYSDASKESEQVQKLKDVVGGVFDYGELTRRAVGPAWKDYSPQEQQQLVDAFMKLLETTYVGKIRAYNNQVVEYVGERNDEQGNVEVQTLIIDKGRRIPVNYRMKKKQDWIVYDIIVEGVSLVKNYRTQFQEIIAKDGAKALISRIKDQAAKVSSSSAGGAS